jgi:hypothetical protein
MTQFKLTKDHLKLLKKMYVTWNACEAGAPSIDPKRPYGTSDVVLDVAQIIGLKLEDEIGLNSQQENKCYNLHQETEIALQIVLATGKFKPGVYKQKDNDMRSWRPIKTIKKRVRKSRSKIDPFYSVGDHRKWS